VDPIRGYLLLAKLLLLEPSYSGSSWNFGPGISRDWTVIEVARQFAGAWGVQPNTLIEYETVKHFAETKSLTIASDFARSNLGWQTKFDTDHAIVMAADWYRAYGNSGNYLAVMMSQIERGFG
jgi:nucleoside-diphosphate-sugar epimerase